MEPLIVTVGWEPPFLAHLNAEMTRQGHQVVGASSEDELRAALADPRVAAAVLGGSLSPWDRRAYRAVITELRPDIPVHLHELRDGDRDLARIVTRTVAELAAGGPAPTP